MSVQNFSFLVCLEIAEKFVVGWWWWSGVGWWWSRPSLGFSFSQAEQLQWNNFSEYNSVADSYGFTITLKNFLATVGGVEYLGVS